MMPRSYVSLMTLAIIAVLPQSSWAGCLKPAHARLSPGPDGGGLQLRGGNTNFAPSRLQRTYSMSAIVPPAADPTHLEGAAHSGDMDVHMITTRKDTTIEATLTSTLGGNLIKQGKTLMMHWAVDPDDNDEWHRPPKEMLPEGTSYRFQKHSVQTAFKLNADGKAEVRLSCPDSIAPKKLRFICFVTSKESSEADVWFKNSNEGDFEMYICPDMWREEIDQRDEEATIKAKAEGKQGGLLSFFHKPFERTMSNLTEGSAGDLDRAPSPPRTEELDGSWRPIHKLQRSKSAEIRHLNAEKRAKLAKDAVNNYKDDRHHVKLSVMLPLDLHKWRVSSLEKRLRKLKDAGVHGVMCDIWWGLVETKPKEYDFTNYIELAKLCQNMGLEVEFVMSFHKCGGNVGDSVSVPLPKWVLKAAQDKGRDFAYYTDRSGRTNDEYLTLGCDEVKFLEGRSPVQCYADFMEAFVDNFYEFFHKAISKVQIGMGPAGELRYPSFPLAKWCYPGPGSFQCYDQGMKASWNEWCGKNGKDKWKNSFPDTQGYNTEPDHTEFFQGGYKSEYGKAFLTWYSQQLLGHGDRVLTEASRIFGPFKIEMSGKIAGIHWLYKHPSHATELTVGYYNTNHNDAYYNIAKLFRSKGATFDFTCMEIETGKDVDHPYLSDPEALVWQAKSASEKAGVKFSGENALPVYDWSGYDMILKKAHVLDSFCFLRLDEDLLNHQFEDFKRFAHKMQPIKRPRLKQGIPV